MANPFEVEDESKEEEGRPATVAIPARAAEKLEKDEDGAVEIDTTPDDEEEELSAASSGSRSDRRRERGRLHKEAEETRAENERLRMENVRLSAQTAALEAVRGYNRREEPQEDPIDREIARVEKSKLHLWEAYNAKAATATPEQIEAYRKDAKELNDRHDQLKHHKYNSQAGVGRPQEDPQTAAIRAGLNMMYPDVMGSPEYRAHAIAAYNLRRVGKQGGGEQEDIVEAMRVTREKYGLKTNKPAPTEAAKRKYMGSSGGAAGRAGPGPGKFVMTKEMQRVADETYSHIKDPTVRYKTWATKVGPKFTEIRARRGEGKRI